MPTFAASRNTTEVTLGTPAKSARRFAALIDLENLAIVNNARISVERMQHLLSLVEPQVVGMPVRVATGPSILRHYMELLCLQRWGLTLVPSQPDAADDALCDAAVEFTRRGATDLVVVGGDHAYVALARHGRLHVISHADHLSNTLRLAATSVALLADARMVAQRAAS